MGAGFYLPNQDAMATSPMPGLAPTLIGGNGTVPSTDPASATGSTGGAPGFVTTTLGVPAALTGTQATPK